MEKTASKSGSSTTYALFGRCYAAEPNRPVREFKVDETMLLNVPNLVDIE
jgi:hypothetical protein